MDIIRWLWETTSISVEGIWTLSGLVAFALVWAGLTLWARLRRPFMVRPLGIAQAIRAALARATETGEQVQVALGVGGVGDGNTTETLAGLYLVDHLARRGALSEVPVRVRVAAPTALVGALAALQRGAASTGYPEAFDPAQAEFIAPTPLAYGAGVAAAMRDSRLAASAMVGTFGHEVLLPGQAGVERGLVQVGGAGDPAVLPLFVGTVQVPLLGEEIYALGAVFGRAEHTGSLAAQDVARTLMALGIVVSAILGLLGVQVVGC